MFVPTGQSSQVSLAFYPRYTKLTKHKIAKFANLSFLDCFPVILEWQAAALNEVAAWLTMTYLIRAKTPLVKNITYFSINLIDAYTTSTLKGAILKAMQFLLIESLRNYSVNFFRDFWTTVQVSALFAMFLPICHTSFYRLFGAYCFVLS